MCVCLCVCVLEKTIYYYLFRYIYIYTYIYIYVYIRIYFWILLYFGGFTARAVLLNIANQPLVLLIVCSLAHISRHAACSPSARRTCPAQAGGNNQDPPSKRRQHVSHNQNPEPCKELIRRISIRNYFWLGLPLTNLHLPGF